MERLQQQPQPRQALRQLASLVQPLQLNRLQQPLRLAQYLLAPGLRPSTIQRPMPESEM